MTENLYAPPKSNLEFDRKPIEALPERDTELIVRTAVSEAVVQRLVELVEFYKNRSFIKSLFLKPERHPRAKKAGEIAELTTGEIQVLATLFNQPLLTNEIIKVFERISEQSGNIIKPTNMASVHVYTQRLEDMELAKRELKATIVRDNERPAVLNSITNKGRQVYDHYFGDL